jgi:hypothetical protein
MSKKLTMFVRMLKTPNSWKESIVSSLNSEGIMVELSFTDISRVKVFYQDPNDKDNRTIVNIEGSKYSIPMPKYAFNQLLDDIKREELFANISLN